MGQERIKSPFGWVGNKEKFLDKILKHIDYEPDYYVEPFAGSGVVLLNTEPHFCDVLNDLNKNVVNFFKVLQDPDTLEELLFKMEMHPYSREQFQDYLNSELEGLDAAVAFWYLTIASFSKKGQHFGRRMENSSDAKKIYDRLPFFRKIHERLLDVKVLNKDCFEVIEKYDSESTIFYIDPPYVSAYNGMYDEEDFGEREHRRLLQLIGDIDGKVILSGEPCDYYDEMKYWDYRECWQAQANIGSREKGRYECVWVKHSTVM
jgi:DNA adenine methylase